jgi:anti-sigma factor RsiW
MRASAQIAPGDPNGLIRVASDRLGSPVTIPDLSRSGYRYAGGQLVATPHGPATLFFYDSANNARLALLTRPMQVDKTAPMAISTEGSLGRVSWAVNGMGYSVVGARSIGELHPIANEVRRQLMRI